MMKRSGVAGVVIGLLLAVGITVPASALSLFGHTIGTSFQGSTTAATTTQGTNTAQACLHYTNHTYEVCYAYIVNSSLGALLPYYSYAHSGDPLLADAVAFHLNERYVGQANTVVTNRVAGWPAGSTDVGLPDIRVTSVTSSLATNTATLHTVESWKVTGENGQVLFQESNVPHTITMHRVPSYILHKWVVTNIN